DARFRPRRDRRSVEGRVPIYLRAVLSRRPPVVSDRSNSPSKPDKSSDKHRPRGQVWLEDRTTTPPFSALYPRCQIGGQTETLVPQADGASEGSWRRRRTPRCG